MVAIAIRVQEEIRWSNPRFTKKRVGSSVNEVIYMHHYAFTYINQNVLKLEKFSSFLKKSIRVVKKIRKFWERNCKIYKH